MTRLMSGFALAAAVLAGGLAAPARASEPGVMRVIDDAKLFTPGGVDAAKAKFDGTTFKSKTHFAVQTVDKIPSAKQAEFDAAKADANARSRFFGNWARDLARSKDRNGDVFALIFMDGKRYITKVVADEQSDVHRHFTDAKASGVEHTLQKGLQAVLDKKLTGAEAKKEMDAALLAATTQVIDDLKDTAAPEASSRRTGRAAADVGGAGGEAKGSGIMGWVCIGLCVLLGVWLVVGLIRAFTGGGGGGGPGGYGGGPGFGGGGGGFMSSLLGGMFGAAAGMYLYDSFMGGHSGGMSEAAASDNSYQADTGDGNYEGGAEGTGAAGGDWGDTGGGDAGGGDWGGGGGDFGGGGDWGGGDAGGGDFGGGDW